MVEESFIAAANGRVLCELYDRSGHSRTVEPYMVYESTRGKRLFHCFQIDGYSKSGKQVGWKNPEVKSFVRATVTERHFRPRPEYNPGNATMFPVIYFSID